MLYHKIHYRLFLETAINIVYKIHIHCSFLTVNREFNKENKYL